MNFKRLVTGSEAAAILGISTKTLWEWVHKGLIPQVRLPGTKPKYDLKDIENIIDNNKSTFKQVSIKEKWPV